jgi:hypothetical protein
MLLFLLRPLTAMTRALRGKKELLLFLAISVETCYCASGDSRLLALVPHDVRVLTELAAPSTGVIKIASSSQPGTITST